MSPSHLERKIDFKEYSCYILISPVFICLPPSLHNMNCFEEDRTNDPFKAVTLAPQRSPSCAVRLTGRIRPSSFLATAASYSPASKFSPSTPTEPSRLLTSSINGQRRVRGRIRLITQMVDWGNISGLSLHNLLSVSCESPLWCREQRQFYVCY